MGDGMIEMKQGKAALKLWAAPQLHADGRVVRDRALVDVEVDGWVLGPLHVADYDVMQTLARLRPLDVSPPGWGCVSMFGQGLGLRHGAGGTRAGVVEDGRRAAMVMWEHVLQHVWREGMGEAETMEVLRREVEGAVDSEGQRQTLGELMVELAAAVIDELACLQRAEDARQAHIEAVDAKRRAVLRTNVVDGLVKKALRLPDGDVGVDDVG